MSLAAQRRAGSPASAAAAESGRGTGERRWSVQSPGRAPGPEGRHAAASPGAGGAPGAGSIPRSDCVWLSKTTSERLSEPYLNLRIGV